MDCKQKLIEFSREYVEKSPFRKIEHGEELSEECMGLILYDLPLIGIASACDPLFERLKKPEVVGSNIIMPEEWLSGAKSVVSFFLPASEEVRKDNLAHRADPSHKWMQMTSEGSRLIRALGLAICDYIIENGFRAIMPMCDERFKGYRYVWQNNDRHYFAAWSERHAAYIAGLGTFSLSRGLITKRGMAGRFGSIITDMELKPDERNYEGIYEYCTFCGACTKRCPAGAITFSEGKRNDICAEFIDKLCADYPLRSSCGKCQVGVPCENKIPLQKL